MGEGYNFNSDIIIGLEIHIELATDTKLFCGCKTHGNDIPNTRTCEVCLGMPGSKPVVNKKAITYALRLCLALNCEIANELIFSRKSYFYPDMSKNYQISQYEMPLGKNGKLVLDNGKNIGITRVHIEEDPASLVHQTGYDSPVLVDYNRSGDPLCEIVTEPELTSPEEARDFMKQLIRIINYLGIFDINRCIIKADANISIKESGYRRVEIKNITGFKEIEKALYYEVKRQKQEVDSIIKETRGWNSKKEMTFSMRKKEGEEEYGYIIDPDLVITDITENMIKETKDSIPELAHNKTKRYIEEHNINRDDAKIISSEKELAELFERISEEIDPILAARWIRKELLRVLNFSKKTVIDIKKDEKHIIELLKLIESKEITDNVAKELLDMLIEKPFSPKEYVEEKGIKKINDKDELKTICQSIINENPTPVEDFKAGKEKALQFLMGKVMAKTKGRADPIIVNNLIKKLIK